jgi:hypothetical protein
MSPESRQPTPSGEADGAADAAGLSVELRALYEQFARTESIAERQTIWNTIVAHQRGREVRVGTDAMRAREAVIERHQRRRLWPF